MMAHGMLHVLHQIYSAIFETVYKTVQKSRYLFLLAVFSWKAFHGVYDGEKERETHDKHKCYKVVREWVIILPLKLPLKNLYPSSLASSRKTGSHTSDLNAFAYKLKILLSLSI